ncbi:hypothetical protein I3760_11G095100 [Carya illinoinensis]|nr:hypothetical protein I3760_11G095100 [Carya illinoinensis]
MTLFLPQTFPSIHFTVSYPLHLSKCSSKFRTMSTPRPLIHATIPARDRVIDFGKHKGKMLGTLSSSYLRWVSKNLRARDFEDWAKLADQVLQDPVYRDRIEWELAENLLNGNINDSSLRNESVVSELLEISERFGWDNEDKSGWSKVKFELLGTSKGGRIPRAGKNGGKETDFGLSKGTEQRVVEVSSKGEERRRARRQRLRTKTGAAREEKEVEELGIKKESIINGGFGNRFYGRSDEDNVMIRMQRDRMNGRDGVIMEKNNNPFPGREALLKKVLNHRRSL